MITEKTLETVINKNNQAEAEEVMNFLDSLNNKEQKDFMIFLQGARFAKNLNIDENSTSK